ncbi:unnamed protein product [Hydatigera taeniaeformis]|uniref:[histone H3]-trimethyl-L-lysine(4) demethylase n=1 Tax=Hydatigena taeniaeformis TaxID=6205 RepID=A0A0R3X0T9_HYDTA|nr:unnamed protein product [Hydatigera taeniaeformis]
MEAFGSASLCSAPVFTPPLEDFDDPIKYVQKIYDTAVKYGICKIKPPKNWSPPFSVNDTEYSFIPRIQRIADVSPRNREKNAFLESLANYWKSQNITVFAQFIRGKQLDMYELHAAVKNCGGYNNVCLKNAWIIICGTMGFESCPDIASAICAKYQRLILPFVSAHNSNVDLSKLIACKKCKKSNRPCQILVCDECRFDGVYHTFCLDIPLSYVPKRWLCPRCFSNEFNKKTKIEANGFRKVDDSCTLRDFSYTADEFKAKYFKNPLSTITLTDVRDEFWRLLNDVECSVIVECGTDLRSSISGSGFPTTPSNLGEFDYCNSPWNLNNLAKNPLSALHYLPDSMAGLKLTSPSCHVGMVFSYFCWDTEDHWSFSINYLHMGEPKTWYAVPGAYADAFEAAMQAETCGLFPHSPDVFHHLITLVPPDRLIHYGVPVCHLDQLAGEFVVTFPRAYHAGYNNGFNFSESVNFCPSQWFPFGLHCVDHYALLHRPPLFSHAELLCRLAESGLEGTRVPITFFLIVTDQLAGLLAKERSLRRHLVRLGVRRTERFVFEALEEDSRECQLCKTTLFTSALTCSCSKSEDQILLYRYGLDELSQFVDRPQERIREYRQWRARVDNFLRSSASLRNAKESESLALSLTGGQIESHDTITEQAGAVDSEGGGSMHKIPLKDLIKLRDVGRQNCYPGDVVASLSKIIETAEACVSMIGEICSQKPESRKRRPSVNSTPRKRGGSMEDFVEIDLPWNPSVTKITMNEFKHYVEKINGLPCTMPEVEELNRFSKRLEEWHISACEVLSLAQQLTGDDTSGDPLSHLPEVYRIERLVAFARSVDVELCHLKGLKHLLECVSWLESVERIMKPRTTLDEDLPPLKEVIDLETRGQMLAYVLHPDRLTGPSIGSEKSITALESALLKGSIGLQKVISEAQVIENAIKEVLEAPNGSRELSEAEALVAQASSLKATFDVSGELAQLCARAHTLLKHFSCFQRLFKSPCVNVATQSRIGKAVKGDPQPQAEGEVAVESPFPDEFVRRARLYTADSTPRVWLRFYEEVCSAAKKLPFVFPDTAQLRNLLNALDRCYTRIRAAFLPSDNERAFTPAILLEVLLPRPKSAYGLLIQRDAEVMPNTSDGGTSGSSQFPNLFDARAYVDACKENVSKFLQELNDGSDFDHMYDTVYTPMIENELQLLHYLRRSNMRKSKERNQNANIDVRRVRYTCPRCERSLRPELSTVIEILEELVPHVTGSVTKQDSGATTVLSDHSPTVKSSITSDLMAPLVSVPFLLKIPVLAAVQMLCERAFAFVRRVRTVILSTPELRKAFMEYETFSGVQMQWNNFNEAVILCAPARQQHAISTHQSEQEPHSVGLMRSHLPPNVVRPPGMQPLVLRTTAPRSLASERLHCLHRQHQFRSPPTSSFLFPHQLQRSISPSRRETPALAFGVDDTDDREILTSSTERDYRNSKGRNEKEAAVALAIMSSTSADLIEPPASPRKQHSPLHSSHFLTCHPRRRTLSGEMDSNQASPLYTPDHQRQMQCEDSMPPAEFRCYIPPDACSWLDTLIGEACALEVSLPQIRWLWQLALAADPDSPGALHPRVVYEDEMALRRRECRRRSIGEDLGAHRRARSCRYNSFERPFYATLAHKGRDSALGLDRLESYGGRHAKRPVSQRRRNKTLPRPSMSYFSYITSRRRFLFRPSRERKDQSETSSRDEEEEAEVNVKEGESKDGGENFGLNTMIDNPVKGKEESCREPSNSSLASISSVVSSPLTGGQQSISSSKSQVKSSKRASEGAHVSTDHRLIAARDFSATGVVRRTSVLPFTRRDRRGGSRMRGGFSRRQHRTLVPRRRSRGEHAVGKVNEEGEWQDFCGAANGCRRPRGTVAWVACDKCNYWYHQRCVGIMSAREVPEVYVCRACQSGDDEGEVGSGRSQFSQPKDIRGNRQPWSILKNEHQQELTGSSASSECVEAMEAQDSSENPLTQFKRSRSVSSETKLGGVEAKKFHHSENMGAEALLQAIAVLEAQPSTHVQPGGNLDA